MEAQIQHQALTKQKAHSTHLTQPAAGDGNFLYYSSSSLTLTASVCHLTDHQSARVASITGIETLTGIPSQFKNKTATKTQKNPHHKLALKEKKETGTHKQMVSNQ